MPRLAALALVAPLALVLACERGEPTTPPEPEAPEPPADAPADEPAEQGAEEVAAPEPEPDAPAAEPEVMDFHEAEFSKDGFEARNLQCSFAEATSKGAGWVKAGLADADAALDACAPKGAAIEVRWSYVSSVARNVEVVASNSKLANCVAKAMEEVHAGVAADCSAVFLLGDAEAATAAFDER